MENSLSSSVAKEMEATKEILSDKDFVRSIMRGDEVV
jgi:hypothetical protein